MAFSPPLPFFFVGGGVAAGFVVVVDGLGRQEAGGGVHDHVPPPGVPVVEGHRLLRRGLGGQEVLQVPQVLLAVGEGPPGLFRRLGRRGRGGGLGLLGALPLAPAALALAGAVGASASAGRRLGGLRLLFPGGVLLPGSLAGLGVLGFTTRPLASFLGASKPPWGSRGPARRLVLFPRSHKGRPPGG